MDALFGEAGRQSNRNSPRSGSAGGDSSANTSTTGGGGGRDDESAETTDEVTATTWQELIFCLPPLGIHQCTATVPNPPVYLL